MTALRIGGALVATVKGAEPVRIGQVAGSVRLQLDASRGGRNLDIGGVAGAIAIDVR